MFCCCSTLPLSSSVRPHNLATGFRPPLTTVVSAEPFSHGTGTLQCLEKEKATYRHWSVFLWWDPDDVSHCRILCPDKTEWRLISAILCRWRCCFVADQLWFMTHIREEKEYATKQYHLSLIFAVLLLMWNITVNLYINCTFYISFLMIFLLFLMCRTTDNLCINLVFPKYNKLFIIRRLTPGKKIT